MATDRLTVGRAWDDQFQGWTQDLQLGRKVAKPKRGPAKSSSWTGAARSPRPPEDYPGKGSPGDVRARLHAIAKRSRQVMVKITPGKNHTMRSVRNHLNYIAKDDEGVVYDQDGRAHQGKAEVDDLAWRWEHTGPKMPERSDVRLAFNIVFSMPEGTDERALFEAVKATAAIEFAGHQWVMGQHFDEPQVHCHVSVKAEGMDGVRLNPRKGDLQRWRERFAHELRERGVEAEATKRAARLQQDKINKPWAVTRLEERGETTNPAPAQPNAARVVGWDEAEKKAAATYSQVIDALHRSSDAADRVLARELAESVVGQRAQRTARPDIRTRPDLERT